MAILCWCILSSLEIIFIFLSINSVIKAGCAFLNFIFFNHDHLGCNKFHLQLCGNVETTLRSVKTLTCNQSHLQRCGNVVTMLGIWRNFKLQLQCHLQHFLQRCDNLMFYWDMHLQSVSIATVWQRWDNVAFYRDINLLSVSFVTFWQRCNNV